MNDINYQEMRFDPHPTQRMVDACCARIAVLEAENERLEVLAQAVCWFDFSVDDHDVFMAVEKLRDHLAALRAERSAP